MRYHERTKHHFNRFAPGPGGLDWANQPDPFRRYAGAPLARLPLLAPDDEPVSPAYDSLYVRGAVPVVPLSIRSLSRLLEYALALSAGGLEVRRARLPRLPARRGPRDRHGADRGGDARLVGAGAGGHGGRDHRAAARPRPRRGLRRCRARKRRAGDGRLAGAGRE